MNGRPDRPLVVKCAFDRQAKKISFSSSRNCSYGLLKAKIDQCFSLYSASYCIAYKDDDGEISEIATDSDLTEAILYFQAGADDPPMSSAMSVLSGRSFGPKRITLRVTITVDYDGPSLSDTSSLVSLDEYRGRGNSQLSLSLGGSQASGEPDDDSVTVSSKDAMGPSNPLNYSSGHPSRFPSAWDNSSEVINSSVVPSDTHPPSEGIGDTGDPSAVFARLKQAEAQIDNPPFQPGSPLSGQWLQDQKFRTIDTMLGPTSAASESDVAPSELNGDLALHRDPRGKYYYAYGGQQSAPSQSQGSGEDIDGGWEDVALPIEKPRPTSMQLNWLASQRTWVIDADDGKDESLSLASSGPSQERPGARSSSSEPLPSIMEWEQVDDEIPQEVLQYLTPAPPPEHELTDCSACGVYLDAFRYVCGSCGPKIPVSRRQEEEMLQGNGKKVHSTEFNNSSTTLFAYPPMAHRTHSNASSSPQSSRTVIGETLTMDLHSINKALPSLPTPTNGSPFSDPGSGSSSDSLAFKEGYELCPSCIESAGVNHALEVSLSGPRTNGHGNTSPTTPEDLNPLSLSQWRRSAPRQKGTLRHVFVEKIWGHRGWDDVQQDDTKTCRCSTCNASLQTKRYKCASCPSFNLCRACYSQVHEIHPSHVFLSVPDTLPARTRSDPEMATLPPPDSDQQSMTHPGVKCAHCMLDIVGARFHCAICDFIDICSNCESAGLPGNLDSDDGGHNSSHIMIKIPFPLETPQVQTMSQRAIHLWTDRDAPNVLTGSRSRSNSLRSSYARTVIGSGTSKSADVIGGEGDHHMLCNSCRSPILGVRYQCASCPTAPAQYNLCTACEERSYEVHDPTHIFFKLPRPVRRLLQAIAPFFPSIYKSPAGPIRGSMDQNPRPLLHSSAVCDRCMSRIEGTWFRCAYCPKDLCDHCEALDTHDDTHIFLVLKAPVNMQHRYFAQCEEPGGYPAVIPYPVYR